MIIQNVSQGGHTDLTFTVPKNDLKKALGLVEGVAKKIGAAEVDSDDHISKISIVGLVCAPIPGLPARCFRSWPKKASTSR